MEFGPPPASDDEALLQELSDLLGDLPGADEVVPEPLATCGQDVQTAPLIPEAVADATAHPSGPARPRQGSVGQVADQHLPTLAHMVRSLNERIARALAAGEPQSGFVPAHRYLVLSVGSRRCGFPLENVVEIGRVLPLVPLPRVPEWLLGLGNLRGHVVPLFDLAGFLGVGALDAATSRRLIVVRPAGGEVFGGFVVDAVHGIRDFPPAEVRGTDTGTAWLDPSYLLGLVDEEKEPVALLDVTRLLLSDAMQQFAA